MFPNIARVKTTRAHPNFHVIYSNWLLIVIAARWLIPPACTIFYNFISYVFIIISLWSFPKERRYIDDIFKFVFLDGEKDGASEAATDKIKTENPESTEEKKLENGTEVANASGNEGLYIL